MDYVSKYELEDPNMYNPDTAEFIGSYDNGESSSSFYYYTEHLYQNEEGEFFIVNYSNNADEQYQFMFPDHEELMEWAEKHLDVDTYVKYFGSVEE